MKALLVVDAQYDFMPVRDEDYKNGQGGALAVPEGDEIVPIINRLLPEFEMVVFTQDWHPKGMNAFASSHPGKKPFDTYELRGGKVDTLWPDHCLAESYGAMIHEGIDLGKINKSVYFFKKGLDKTKHPYSGFDGTGLAFFLQERGVDEVYIVGLALDYCVKDTAIDAVKNNFKTIVVKDGTRAIAKETEKIAIQEFFDNGIDIIDSNELNLYKLMP